MKRLGIFCLLLVLSSAASANQYVSRGYFGVGFGNSKSDIEGSNFTNPSICNIVGSVCTVDNKDSSKQIYAGYNFTPRFSVEGAYTDLGTIGKLSDGTIDGSQTTRGLSLSLKGNVPLSRAFSLYGKIGAYRWDSEVNIPRTNEKTASVKGTDAVVGFGLEYKITPKISARLGWDRYNNVGEKTALLDSSGIHTVRTDVDVYSIGIHYNF